MVLEHNWRSMWRLQMWDLRDELGGRHGVKISFLPPPPPPPPPPFSFAWESWWGQTEIQE